MERRDAVPADPGARRFVLAIWLAAATAGTAAVWRLAAYIEYLTALGRIDRAAAATLFRSRVLPALWAVALLSVMAGVVLARHGLEAMRAGRVPPEGAPVVRATPIRRGARATGVLLMTAGVLMALTPLGIAGVITWAIWSR